jgi:signal peptidase I
MGKSPTQKAVTAALAFCLLMLLIAAFNGRYKLAVQYDYSVNFLLAILDIKQKEIEKNDYFAFQFLAVKSDDRYGQKFVKRLGCAEGEYLEARDRDFYCNGTKIGTVKPYSKKGEPLTPFKYAGLVPRGHLFAVGDTKDSYDSKIWGFVDKNWIIGRVTKVF